MLKQFLINTYKRTYIARGPFSYLKMLRIQVRGQLVLQFSCFLYRLVPGHEVVDVEVSFDDLG